MHYKTTNEADDYWKVVNEFVRGNKPTPQELRRCLFLAQRAMSHFKEDCVFVAKAIKEFEKQRRNASQKQYYEFR